jgi:beta-lactam-binding protein with PASTA domain
VTSKPIPDATALLEQAGLRVGMTGRVATSTLGAGRVLSQRPAPSASVPNRSSVDVTVAIAPMPTPVPDVTGRDAASATKSLTDTLFLPLRVDVFGTSGQLENVVEQAPTAGTDWMTGRPVAIAVAAGPAYAGAVAVPALKGKTLDASRAELAKVGLVAAGFLTNITTPQANVVVDQLPEGGVLVRPGTTVLLLLKSNP